MGIMTEERVMVKKNEADGRFVMEEAEAVRLRDERKRFRGLYGNLDVRLERWLNALRRDLEHTRRLNRYLGIRR